ncbi:uncharacterized protein LOC124910364 [Impatiens glandulifera]|uniref:uncharacterized protein LOC124910364 n=1 Tax=Impatiens glandulifera TaxID=253017 RepID=UPI001FB17B81|nr:uncharacterized protein LOC124910364 [Impatiens glandulifera]
MVEEKKPIKDELSLLILHADRVIKSAQFAESSKSECIELAKQADHLSNKLRSALHLVASSPLFYDRPLRRVAEEISNTLHRALTLVRKCRHGTGVFCQVFSITTAADFRKVDTLLQSSIADVSWVLSVFDPEGDVNLSMPPIATNDPILAWVWSYIASAHMGQLQDWIESANSLCSLAVDNDRNKKIIIEEGGVPPLLKLLKDGSSPEGQIAASTALRNLGNDPERVRSIACELAVPIIVQVLVDSPMKVQESVANLVSIMAEMNAEVREELGKENATKPLVTLLSMDVAMEESKHQTSSHSKPPVKTSIHSIVQRNKDLSKNPFNRIMNQSSSLSSSSSSSSYDGSSRHSRKDREAESPEQKLRLKISCAEALWKLCKGSVQNCRKITEAKGLLCLAKLIKSEHGELQYNCLMTVMELAYVAEGNTDLRRSLFKSNSPAAKAILEQLLLLVNQETSPELLKPAIKTIGYLALTFTAKETRIIGCLVPHLSHGNTEVGSEATVALCKFASPENYNREVHSKAIIEAGGVAKLMNLRKIKNMDNENIVHELVLLCYLALNVGNSKALEEERVLIILEGAARSVVPQYPGLRELFFKAVHNLTLYQAGDRTNSHTNLNRHLS